MEEIPLGLGCIKPCKSWDKLDTYQLVKDFFPQQYVLDISVCKTSNLGWVNDFETCCRYSNLQFQKIRLASKSSLNGNVHSSTIQFISVVLLCIEKRRQ